MKTMISTITLGLLAAIASGAAIANPAPAPEFNNEITNVPAGPLQLGKRDLTYLYVCSDINFQGKCLNLEINRGQCYNLQKDFNDVISSLGPPVGTTCVLWDDFACGSNALVFQYPGFTDLRQPGWNDLGSSYECY